MIANRDWWLLILAVTLLLILVPTLRLQQGAPIGESIETYTVLNQYNQGDGGLYPGIVGLFASSFGVTASLYVVPIIFALVFLFIVRKLLAHTKASGIVQLYTFIIIVTLPVFIHAFIGFSNYQLLLVLVGLLALALLNKHKLSPVLQLLVIIVQPIVGILISIGLLYRYVDKKNRNPAILTFVALVVGIAVSSTLLRTLSWSFSINELFSFFGGFYGFSLFICLLGVYGLLQFMRPYTSFTKVAHAIVLVLSIVHEPTRVLASLCLAYYAAHGFYALEKRTWLHETTGQLTLVLFGCILLFSTIVVVQDQISAFPNAVHEQIVEDLNTLPVNRILTDPNYAAFYSYNGFDILTVKESSNENVLERLFTSQSLRNTGPILVEQQINTIIIDDTMRQGGIWQRPDEGLLFILQNSNDFNRSLEYPRAQVFMYDPQE